MPTSPPGSPSLLRPVLPQGSLKRGHGMEWLEKGERGTVMGRGEGKGETGEVEVDRAEERLTQEGKRSLPWEGET